MSRQHMTLQQSMWKKHYPMFKVTQTEYKDLQQLLKVYLNTPQIGLCGHLLEPWQFRLRHKIQKSLAPDMHLHNVVYSVDTGFTLKSLKYLRYIWIIKLLNYNRPKQRKQLWSAQHTKPRV